MSVVSTDNKVIYDGDGALTSCPFAFAVYATSEVLVQTLVIATGATTTLVLGEGYTVALSGDVPSAGTVTLTEALPATKKVILTRQLPLTQQISLVDNEQTPAKTFEEGYDRGVMIAQQLQEQIDRALLQDPTATTQITLPAPVASFLLAWNSDGSGFENVDPATLEPGDGGGGGGGGGDSSVPTPSGSDGNKLLRVNADGSAYVLSTMVGFLDTIFGSTRGLSLRRGASAWEAVTVGAANTVYKSDGTDPAWGTLTALLDAAFGSTRGALLHRGAAAWALITPGTNGQFLKTFGAAADAAWASLPTGNALWEFVETLTLTGTDVSTATLPTDADLFLLVFQEAGGCDLGLGLRFNADSGANYDYSLLPAAGSTALTGATGQTSIRLHTSGDGNDRVVDGTVLVQRSAVASGNQHGVTGSLAGRGPTLIKAAWTSDAAITSATIVGIDSGTAALTGKVHLFKLTRQ